MVRRLLTTLCLMGGVALGTAFMASSAEALAWYGFSKLCFAGLWKGGSVKDGELVIVLTNFTVQVRCQNTAGDGNDYCQPGGGNSGGSLTVQVPAVNSAKYKGVVTADGCIDLINYDHHYDFDPTLHSPDNPDNDDILPLTPNLAHVTGGVDGQSLHSCLPLDNPNKIEIHNSAYISRFDAEYWLYSNFSTGQISRHGTQACVWRGTFNPDTCQPSHSASGYDPENPDPNLPSDFDCTTVESKK